MKFPLLALPLVVLEGLLLGKLNYALLALLPLALLLRKYREETSVALVLFPMFLKHSAIDVALCLDFVLLTLS
ncbi:MAG: hypothetical protein MPF33_11020 [Candidatus Aramenus sp.]|jgi:hypothetical protein|nr:hypothetical protein [Candidatus Aramenus sp.]